MSEQYQKSELTKVVELLKNGKCVAFPTDTVYGLGVVYDDEQALQNLKLAKGRPEHKPIPMMVANLEQLKRVAILPERFEQLASKYMPGPLTLILAVKDSVPGFVTNNNPTIAIRIPDDEFILELISKIDKPLLVTSANLSDHEPGTNTEEVLAQLNGRIDAIVEGQITSSVPSTIVNTVAEPLIIRLGALTEAQIMEEL